MERKKLLIRLVLGSAFGAALALFVLAAIRTPHQGAHASEGRSLKVLATAPFYRDLERLALLLEEGTVSVQELLDTTALLTPCLHPEMRGAVSDDDGKVNVGAPLLWQGVVFGHLVFLDRDPDGQSRWELRTAIDAPARYQGLAESTHIAIMYRGINGVITAMAVSCATHMHKNDKTAELIRTAPFVIGGYLVVKAEWSTWRAETLIVDESMGVPQWTSTLSTPEKREEALDSADSHVVAAMLFSL